METYNFPYYVLEDKYPESSAKISFGGGYEFASQPRAPDQITFMLHYDTMVFIESSPGTLDLVTRPTLNMGVLRKFYEDHRLWDPFIFPHPILGNVTVRFNKPLSYKLRKNGRGSVEPFTVELLLQP
jgi:hypothetical protein